MNGQANPTHDQMSSSRAVLRVLLPVFLVFYAALPIAVARNAR
jgi:hypothetical protein